MYISKEYLLVQVTDQLINPIEMVVKQVKQSKNQ